MSKKIKTVNKVCRVCGQKKPVEKFNVRYAYYKEKRYSYLHECKPCYRKRIKKWVSENKERYLEIQRVAQKKYTERHPKKEKAHKVAKRNRAQIKATHCEICFSVHELEMHHPDYDCPLEVVTLCGDCHRSIHGKN